MQETCNVTQWFCWRFIISKLIARRKCKQDFKIFASGHSNWSAAGANFFKFIIWILNPCFSNDFSFWCKWKKRNKLVYSYTSLISMIWSVSQRWDECNKEGCLTMKIDVTDCVRASRWSWQCLTQIKYFRYYLLFGAPFQIQTERARKIIDSDIASTKILKLYALF